MMGNFTKNILVADNDPDSLAAVQFNMKMAGYRVYPADSPEMAKQILEEQIIHLAIIDMRLRNDKEIEYSGFDVAACVPSYIPFIIYTAFEDRESIRRALGRVGAKESLDKKKPGAAAELVEAVDRLFRSDVKVNFDLSIEGKVTCEEIAGKIGITSHEGLQPSVEDVRQIFQSLFHQADGIFISPLFSSSQLPNVQQSGSLVVLVQPRFKSGWGERQVVKFSEVAEVRNEEINYKRIKPFLGGTRVAVLGESAISRKIGGLVYTLIDAAEWDSIQLFGDYYCKSSSEEISGSLERFFRQTFGTIFKAAKTESVNITKSYCNGFHLTPQKLTRAMSIVRPTEFAEPHLHFKELKGKFLNPVLWFLPGGEFRRFEEVSKVSLCHGDLHGRNILVGSDEHYWLIDFARVDETHAVRDFIELETDIKFNLMKDTDLNTLLRYEYSLLMPKKFSDSLPDIKIESPSLRKSYQVIASLRHFAIKYLSLDGDMREYYEALLINTLNMLRLRHIQAAKKEHVLLSASLICQRLDHWPEWESMRNNESLPGFWGLQTSMPAQEQIEDPVASSRQDLRPEIEKDAAHPLVNIVAGSFFFLVGTVVILVLMRQLSVSSISWQDLVALFSFLSLLAVITFVLLRLIRGEAGMSAILNMLAMLTGKGNKRRDNIETHENTKDDNAKRS